MWAAISSCYNGLACQSLWRDRGRIPGIQVFFARGDHVHFADRLKLYSFQDIPALIAYYFRKRGKETYSAATHYLLAAVVGCLKVHRLKWLIPSASCEVYLIIQSLVCSRIYPEKSSICLTVDRDNPDLESRFASVTAARSHRRQLCPQC